MLAVCSARRLSSLPMLLAYMSVSEMSVAMRMGCTARETFTFSSGRRSMTPIYSSRLSSAVDGASLPPRFRAQLPERGGLRVAQTLLQLRGGSHAHHGRRHMGVVNAEMQSSAPTPKSVYSFVTFLDPSSEQDLLVEQRVDSVDGTWEVAKEISDFCDEGDVVLLLGDVGAGKTTFARGFVRHFTADEEVTVASPSFLLHLQYPGGPCTLHHLDLYRLGEAKDVSFLGLDQLIPKGVSLIEWPCPSLAPALPESFLCVYLCETDDAPATVDEAKDEDEEEDEDEDGEFALPAMDGPRKIQFLARGDRWRHWAAKRAAAVGP